MALPCFLRDCGWRKTLAWRENENGLHAEAVADAARRRLAALLRVPLRPALAVIVLMLAMLSATVVVALVVVALVVVALVVVALVVVALVVVRRACARGRCRGR